jgi:hypothetical protein
MSDLLYQRFKEQECAARYRGIPWRLAYWEWLQIWQDSGHLHERGTCKGQWVMSRPGDRGAYEVGNVRIVRCETNNREAQEVRRRLRQPELRLAA